MKRDTLILSCEHGGNEVPADYRHLFAEHAELLATHRGWDPGALELARELAEAFGAPLFFATTTRLLVDPNRSIGHRDLHSEATRHLPPAERERIVAQHYQPHRDAIEAEVARRVQAGERVLHIASHSFTPQLRGVTRPDAAWLYDPRRAGERLLAAAWMDALHRRLPTLRLRRNFPYQGKADGLTALLRRKHPAADYVGIELEVNQQFVLDGGPVWAALKAGVRLALADALAGAPAR